jgi:hypothetical protein
MRSPKSSSMLGLFIPLISIVMGAGQAISKLPSPKTHFAFLRKHRYLNYLFLLKIRRKCNNLNLLGKHLLSWTIRSWCEN